MYCTQCGRRLPPGDVRFCAHCGARLQLPVAPTDEAATRKDRTPWGYADMAMAIGIVIGALILLSIPIILIIDIVAGGSLDDDEAETAIALGLGFVLEAVLLLAVALLTIGKYNLRWSELGFRLPRRGSRPARQRSGFSSCSASKMSEDFPIHSPSATVSARNPSTDFHRHTISRSLKLSALI